MSAAPKKLTEPPTNLKEAIDWVLCMSGNDGRRGGREAIKMLAEKVIGLVGPLNHGGRNYGHVHGQHIGTLLGGDFSGSGYGAGNYKPIESLGNGLRVLIGWQGGTVGQNGVGKPGGYQSSYSDENPSQTVKDEKAAKTFLGSIPLIFFALGFLYWQCKGGWAGKDLSDGPMKAFLDALGFPAEQLNKDTDGSQISAMFAHFDEFRNVDPTPTFPAFLKKVDKESKKIFQATPSHVPLYAICLIALRYMKNKSTLTTDRIPQTKKEIIDMLSELREAVKSLDGSNLTKFSNAYLELNTAITDAMKSTESTSPPAGPIAGTLSTLGLGGGAAAAYLFNLGGAKTLIALHLPLLISLFDCPCNLKEAIDWILRVTGKDGVGGTDGTNDLTEQVKNLLNEVKDVVPGLKKDEFENVKSALTQGKGDNLITKLAEGLQQFIGYEPGSSNITGKITGGGILPANVARHQVCNAVLNFVIRFLEGLSKVNEALYKQNVLAVIVKLRKCVGTGKVPQGFKVLVEGIKEKVEKGFDSKINTGKPVKTSEVFQALHSFSKTYLNSLERQLNITSETSAVQSYITTFAGALKPDGSNTLSNLFNALKTLFENQEINAALQTTNAPLTLIQNKLENNINSVKNSVKQLAGEINKLNNEKGVDAKPANAAVFTAVRDAATAFIAELQTKTYTSLYDKHKNPEAEWSKVSSDDEQTKCAKIFLGCLPLYYQALTYIYWGCHDNGGGWRNQTLAGGTMRSYFDSQGFVSPYVESSRTGAHMADSALKGFSEFQAAASSLNDSKYPYVKFTNQLQEAVKTERSTNLTSKCPLSGLYMLCTCYIQCQQMTIAKSAVHAPKTIREMLYFLAALQFSPQYDAFDRYVTEYFKAVTGNPSQHADSELKLQVADSGITPKPGSSSSSDTLSAADVKSYLASTFLLPPSLLGWLQEPSTSGDPWLHSIFSNSQFNLSIPSSGAGLFNALSNYSYALQFQLSFLYIQCRDTYTKACGWNQCTYGKGINSDPQRRIVQSHICVTGCTTGGQHTNGNHPKPDECKHDGCGSQSNKPSPLQAFLTDKLKGLCRKHPGTSSHLATCSGSLCHVPMGFAGKLRTDAGGGLNIAYALGSFCGGFNTPLRQLSEKLGCLTKRTPRTLGDMFGFTWHLKGQLAKSFDNITNAEWLKNLVGHTPFSNNLIEEHGKNLTKFVGTDHTSHGNSPADLTALYSSGCNQKNQNCGPYLYPLTHSDGATFGKPAPYASTYLSWVLYLTDELETGLQELLDTFKNIDCSKTGCRGNTTGSKCGKNHANGTHGSNNDCSCDSVVHCGGVLPLLYRYGFTFSDMGALFGEGTNGTKTKRTCEHFHTQLQSVINGEPLRDLFTSIDAFLFLFRKYFLGNNSGFWSIYICLILYTFFFLLDTLHVRSHLKLTSSHTVPPLALLTSGHPVPVTKLTKPTYFIP
ncbi:variant erythrocyte surface antigen-1 family protein [Babesia caballi]|uniref:Variant erythrocyte surface antigen-1 family protein n=1 Tax=Babesia caballi TaxID=5871 RepID=A0AAV4LWJ2_BABCB|nr:variant erythrocyte surface antigen-1 family protein [Babesia caballi]